LGKVVQGKGWPVSVATPMQEIEEPIGETDFPAWDYLRRNKNKIKPIYSPIDYS